MRPILAALPAKAGQDVAVDVEFAHTSSDKNHLLVWVI